MDKARVGFIGIGKMGAGMAARIADAGFPLTVYDVRAEAVANAKGVTAASSPRELASAVDFICTSLPGPQEAEEVFFGADGVLAGVREGTVCVDFTTNSPTVVRRIAAALAERGADMLDAPVSGGVEGARTGQLTVLAGGRADSLAKCRSLLDVLATSVLHVGEIGSASVCKLLHNCAVFVANLATVECLTAGVKAGMPAATLVEVFQKSGLGRNLDLQVAMPATLFRGKFEPRYLMRLALKDMKLATELARNCGAPMELAATCERDMQEAVDRGWSELDNTIFLTLREQRVGTAVRIES
jgi:3-hydroxyisobutyrate dehydrogenase-like beta-hydroxyacid dehydrogenase